MKARDTKKLFPHDHLLKPLLFFIPQTVKPNHITVLRMLLTPVVMWFLYIENYQVGVPLFLFTAFTDALDGTVARVRKQITEWGIFYDPVADKILIGSVILLIVIQHVNPFLAVALIVVELLIIVGGWYQRQRGIMRSANVWGKVKMFLEVTGVMFLLIALWLGVDLFVDLSHGTLVLAVIFAVVSLLTYSL
ncbi:CDP-alcohol phosphatidyltransferase family protein [Patescibacteria group bacterium]|nr:CDP-alcohol phosphatidyltransferase family protein [Patescibacteria group bacterium]